MTEDEQTELLSPITELRLAQILVADLHDDLHARVSRFRQLNDLSLSLGKHGTMLAGGETCYAAWIEARTSFINGNYMATVMLCQGLVEHLLAAFLRIGLQGEELPSRVAFSETLRRSLARNIIGPSEAEDLRKLMDLRNPLSHFRDINDPSNLSRRAMESHGVVTAQEHLLADASFAIATAIRIMSLPSFRVG